MSKSYQIKHPQFRTGNHSTFDTFEPSEKSSYSEPIYSMVESSFKTLSNQEFGMVITRLLRLLGIKSHMASLKGNAAQGLNILGQLEEISKSYEIPSQAYGYLLLCQCQLAPNQHSFRMRSKVRQIITQNPNHHQLLARVFLFEGDVLLQQNLQKSLDKYVQCLQECEKALNCDIYEDDIKGIIANVHYKLGVINKMRDEKQQSVNHLQEALRLCSEVVIGNKIISHLKQCLAKKTVKTVKPDHQGYHLIQIYSGAIETVDMQQADLLIQYSEEQNCFLINLNVKGIPKQSTSLEFSLQNLHIEVTIHKLKMLGNDLSWLSYRYNKIYVDSQKIEKILNSMNFRSRRKVHKCTKPQMQSQSEGESDGPLQDNASLQDFKAFLSKSSPNKSHNQLST